MTSVQLKESRISGGLTQQRAAARLGVSQSYYSQLESGARPVPANLAVVAVKRLGMPPTSLPLPALTLQLAPLPPVELARELAGLGYPGFAQLARKGRSLNPAEVMARALANSDLDPRLVEALPWVVATFAPLNWTWLVAQCRLMNLQNRLGFVASLAGSTESIAEMEASRLAAEGTLCRESMPEAERNWLRKHRPPLAAHWNLLTMLTADGLTHAT